MQIKLVAAFFAASLFFAAGADMPGREQKGTAAMSLGNFSISLAVKDIKASHAFYKNLGFKDVGGDIEQNWVILQNDQATIGLFQGMFERNTLTFNPGWDRNQKTPSEFKDIRDIQTELEGKGVQFALKADPESTGPASFVIADPDGNPVLFDQHVPKPQKKD